MSDREIKLELIDKVEKIAKEVAKGNDVYITKSASGVVVKKMTVGKV
jgi:phage-related minor tail protein